MKPELLDAALDVANLDALAKLRILRKEAGARRRATPIPDCPQPESRWKRIVNPPLVHSAAPVDAAEVAREWERMTVAARNAAQRRLAAARRAAVPFAWLGGAIAIGTLLVTALVLLVARAEGWLP